MGRRGGRHGAWGRQDLGDGVHFLVELCARAYFGGMRPSALPVLAVAAHPSRVWRIIQGWAREGRRAAALCASGTNSFLGLQFPPTTISGEEGRGDLWALT